MGRYKAAEKCVYYHSEANVGLSRLAIGPDEMAAM